MGLGPVRPDQEDPFRSPAYAKRESRLLWPAVWVYVGTGADIPKAGDVLPYTVGDIGIHVERTADGGLQGRMNRAQHGGCGVIPMQCQTGTKTRCPQISCGFSRDGVQSVTADSPERDRWLFQLIGLRPDRLASVAAVDRGGLIRVNLLGGPEVEDFVEGGHSGPGGMEQRATRWITANANWKVTAKHLAQVSVGSVPAEVQDGVTGWTAHYAFPNLVVLTAKPWRCVVVLQPLGPGATLCRASLFGPHGCLSDAVMPDLWNVLIQACCFAEREQAENPARETEADPAYSIVEHVERVCAASTAHGDARDRNAYRPNPRYGFSTPSWHV
jgi:hypothetical protein